ncbi:hypothetical protein HK099_001805, partial [Clydaea vesicula]
MILKNLISLKNTTRCISNIKKKEILSNKISTNLNIINKTTDEIDHILQQIDKISNFKLLQLEYNNLEKLLQSESIWDDQKFAIKTQKKHSELSAKLTEFDSLKEKLFNLRDLAEIGREAQDEVIIQEVVPECEELLESSEKYKLKNMMRSENDKNSCFLEINAGSGGMESCDFVSMLSKMYIKWGENYSSDLKVSIVDELVSEGGFKQITVRFHGEYAFGWLKNESGVHRLVRISPFDDGGRRHTSFCSVTVLPESQEEELSKTMEIPSNDLKIETMRAQVM